jgi:energy-coupling factor transporter ATP-binding protein EcfA2
MPESLRPERRNPFPGLRPFRSDEDHLFFGREEQVDSMITILAKRRFLAVVGTSGSGKSSLVNCGLEPALHQGLMASAGSHWRIAKFRPEDRPIQNLARALARDGVLFSNFQDRGLSLVELIESTLRLSTVGLLDIVDQASRNDTFPLLLVVDQFEELFRYSKLDAVSGQGGNSFSEEATAFVSLLLAVLEAQQEQIHIVLTMRSDFLGDCTQFPGLAEAINRALYLVPRLTREERRAAITNPVLVAGATISPVLVTRLVNDVGDNPDQLSILQHALNRTWAHWQNLGASGSLELSHYEAIGTMAEALDRHAEAAYAELGEGSVLQTVCRDLFQAITDRASDGRGIRRPTKWGQLQAITMASEQALGQVIEVFRHPSRAFLMPPAGTVLDEESMIDISHESLMRVWRRLKTWGDAEALAAQIYRRLAETAELHASGSAGTLREPELTLFRKWEEELQPNAAWAERYRPGFDKTLHFLQRSQEESDAEQAEREQKERQKVKQLRRWSIGMGALAVIAAVLGGVAWVQLEATKLATARGYATLASAQVDRDPFEALIHGLAAAEHLADEPGDWLALGPTLESAIQRNWQIGAHEGDQGGITSLVEQRNGEWVSGGADGTLQRWRTGRKVGAPILTGHQAVTSLVVLRNGDLLSGGPDGKLQRWRDGQKIGTSIDTESGPVLSLEVLNDGDLLSGGFDGNLQRWRDGRKIGPPIATGQMAVFSLLELKNGDWISGGLDGTLQRWRDGRKLDGPIATGQGPVRSLAELPNGEWVSGGFDGNLQHWRDGKKIDPPLPTGHGEVRTLELLGNGQLVSGGPDGSLRVWHRGQENADGSFEMGPLSTLVQLRNGDLLTDGHGSGLQLWRNGKTLGAPKPTDQGAVRSLLELRNGDWISGGENGTLQRWHNGRKTGEPKPTGQVAVRSLLELRNGDWISGGENGTLQRWHNGRKTGEPIRTGQVAVRSLLELRNGDWISGGENGTLQRWHNGRKTGEPIRTGQGAVLSLLELRNGDWISGGENGTLQRWRNGLEIGGPIATIATNGGVIRILEHQNGDLLSVSLKGFLKRWLNSQEVVEKACKELSQHPALDAKNNGSKVEKAARAACQRLG